MSAFEHVFVGEISNGLVRGFHNWVQLYLEERQKNLRYKGFEACDKHIITIDFTWKNGSSKTNGSFFLGTSPEFELAIYTVCFLVGDRRKDETAVTLGNKPTIIFTHRADGQIGTCYPKLQEQSQLPERRPDDVRIQVELEENSANVRGRSKRSRSCCSCIIL
ncbi:uridylate-specific endoribonuclease B-like [Branchiostoma lanceolatum]|uniref:uridylate-specific endoribonuclease B-like n=1 Tax=Branchiostoma lanceolatum TaxID=7740 RepID=UPI003455BE9C